MASTFAVSPVSAAVTTISSSSTVLDVSLIVPGVISILLGPVLSAAGLARPPYDVTNSNSLSLPLLGLSSSSGDRYGQLALSPNGDGNGDVDSR